MLLAVAAAAWCGRWVLWRWATKADAALAQADGDSRAQYVVLSRNIERREHERLLHDTVLNTLTALSRASAGTAGVIGRCRYDVTLMEFVLGAPGSRPAAPGPRGGGLAAAIEAVASEMEARGLDVHVQVTDAGPAKPADAAVVPVPVAVAMAMAHAVREALVNVANHAGTAEAWVEVALAVPDGQGGKPDGVCVTVRDTGQGFDPASVDPVGLACGDPSSSASPMGRAGIDTVATRPGHGGKPALARDGGCRPASRRRRSQQPGRAMVSRAEEIGRHRSPSRLGRPGWSPGRVASGGRGGVRG